MPIKDYVLGLTNFYKKPSHRNRKSRPAIADQNFSLYIANLEKILLENIIPFWYPEVMDFSEGGYRLNHDFQGKWQGRANKSLVAHARTVWFFSRLVNSEYGTQDHLKAAEHGYEFMRDQMWDRQFGGFYWEVNSSGKIPTKPAKHIYGQAFALYALSEFSAAAKDSSAREFAQDLFCLLDEKAHDLQYGGYREFFHRDWSLVDDSVKTYLISSPSMKLMNTHLHLIEAITAYHRLSRDTLSRDRLIELILVLSTAVRGDTIHACTDKFSRDWMPLDKLSQFCISYGHILEIIWFLMTACRTAGISDGPLLNLYHNFFCYAVRFGRDKNRGGFYYEGSYNSRAKRREKVWWVQAEALVSALMLYQHTREHFYLESFSQILDWLNSYQIDWQYGDWHAKVSESGKASGDKAGAWKTPYHNGRAIIECIQILVYLAKCDPSSPLTR